jgi:hypothetical protein
MVSTVKMSDRVDLRNSMKYCKKYALSPETVPESGIGFGLVAVESGVVAGTSPASRTFIALF